MNALKSLRAYAKGFRVTTTGLQDKHLAMFLRDPNLISAVTQARQKHAELTARYNKKMKQDEPDLCREVQKGFLNFYGLDSTNPYVALAAQGPWIVTSCGSVIYDTGGYGMLGFGHNSPVIANALSKPQVMANIMTPSFTQPDFVDSIRKEIGHSRGDGVCPFESFVCLNSGSEANSLAMRISNVDVANMTGPNGPHAGWTKTALVSLVGSFHGRTDRPGEASDSSRGNYIKHLHSYQSGRQMDLRTVQVNNVQMLKDVMDELAESKTHCEAIMMEPVMGEGNPGIPITRKFYDEAREQATKHRSLLMIDSIQAGLRTRGTLSVMDYPGFEDALAPDMEVFSKAINGGQFPLSIVALGPTVPAIYVRGLYGNTMTTNPRALEIASAVLNEFAYAPEMRENIVEMGKFFKTRLRHLATKHPEKISRVTGSGLLVAVHLKPGFPNIGLNSVEMKCRQQGLGVIHGGHNALRFTPHFYVTEAEIELIVRLLDDVLTDFKKDPDHNFEDVPLPAFECETCNYGENPCVCR